MLKPIMCYGSEVWGFTGDQNLERVELYFLKSILHLPSVAPNTAVFGELGQLPVHLHCKNIRFVLNHGMVISVASSLVFTVISLWCVSL